ncbi:unnamed protein product [Ectocarpus sp. CCAP 1310/34]|nr:unnamed protein product [Ectocarpus sp. CCAP 1310/34]
MAEPPSPQQQQQQIPPPRTGTTLPFIWPPPHHLQTPPPFEEPVLPFPPPESLLVRETKLDALRCEEPDKHQGQQVYDSLTRPPRAGVNYAQARGATADEDMPRWYSPTGPEDDTVMFESRFESGNLRSAERIGESEYNLQLAFDINTDRHTQWFYFRMSNIRRGRPYKLNMQNLMKTEAVYNLGMQPLAYSESRAEQEGVGWYRTGSDACYFKNQLMRAGLKPFWTLTFTVQTSFDQDTLYLAHCFPYRYSDLQQYLSKIQASPLGACSAIRRRRLCETLAGNECDLLTISTPGGDHANKKGIVISARVHPGETNASWMMKGVLDYLSSDCHCAVALRDKFIFKIVPMLNPDGVVVGNYRCSLAGGDLNRQYDNPKRELFPEVLHLKQMISNFGIGNEVLLYVDLHGHSKKSNIFMYGVENPTDEALYMRERIIPTLLHQASPFFNFADCTFDIGKGKEGCGRVVVRKQLGIVNAYTMEASFMGADQGEFQGIHFHQGHYEAMGHSLCEVLLDLVDTDQSKVEGIVRRYREKCPIDQSRVVSKRDDYGNGDSSNSSASSSSDDDNDSDSGRRHHHRNHNRQRQVTRPSSSKPSTPTGRESGAGDNGKSRPGPRPASSSAEKNGTPRQNGSGNKDEGKGGTPRGALAKSKSVTEQRTPPTVTKTAVPPKITPTPVARHSKAIVPTPQKSTPSAKATKPDTPKGSSKAAGEGAAGKNASSKNASSKTGGPANATAASSSAGSKTSGGAREKGATAGNAAKERSKTASSSPRVSAVTTVARGESPKLAAPGRSKSISAGGGGPKRSKIAGVPPLALPRRSTTTTASDKKGSTRNSSSAGTKGKPKGVPLVGTTPPPPRRPASSPGSRSVASPRRRATSRADPPKRSPSAPPPKTTGPKRAEASSNATNSRSVGAAGGGGKGKGKVKGTAGGGGKAAPGGTKKGEKNEALPLPPLRSKSHSTATQTASR